MPHKVSYNLLLGTSNNQFKLGKVDPSRALLIGDRKLTSGTISRLTDSQDFFIKKRLFEKKDLARKTKFYTNSGDALLTDIYDDVNNPLYWKTPKKVRTGEISIDGEAVAKSDNQFIYHYSNKGKVEYFLEGRIVESGYPEFFPVFVWDQDVHLARLFNMDGKKYSLRRSGDRIEIIASKPNVALMFGEGSISSLRKLKNDLYEVKPFLFKQLRSLSGSDTVFEYDYTNSWTNVRTVHREAHPLEQKINLRQNRVVPESVSIFFNKGEDLVEVSEVGANRIYSEDGVIDLVSFAPLIGATGIIYVTYQYVENPGLSSGVDTVLLPDRSKNIHFFISPTSIVRAGSRISFEQEISYSVVDEDGSLIKTNHRDIPSYEYKIPMFLGYGEAGYGEHGYGGVSEDGEPLAEAKLDAIEEYGFGYGSNGYGEGPYGGSYIKNIKEVKELLSLRAAKESGSVEIAVLDTSPQVRNVHVFINDKLSTVGYDYDKLSIFNGSLVRFSETEGSSLKFAAGVSVVDSIPFIDFNGRVESKTSTTIIVSFDIEKYLSTLDEDFALKEDMLISGEEFDSYLETYFKTEDEDDHLSLFTKNQSSFDVVDLDIKIMDRMAFVAIPKDLGLTNIGLGFSKVKPGIFVEI